MVDQTHEFYVPYFGMALLLLGLVGSITGILVIVRKWIDVRLGAIQKDMSVMRQEMETGKRCPITGRKMPEGLGHGNISGQVQIREMGLAEKAVKMEQTRIEQELKKQQGVKIQVGGNG